MELLDIVDEHGVPTGQSIDREKAHELGIAHRTSHVWIIRIKHGKLQVLLQRRSDEKDSFPGCYDISSAGHIPAGMSFVDSALRELKEELGFSAKPEQLIECGQRHFCCDEIFRGKEFHDNQVTKVYALWLDQEPEEFTLQKEEVSEILWLNFDECLKKVEQNLIPHCIYPEELNMVKTRISNPKK